MKFSHLAQQTNSFRCIPVNLLSVLIAGERHNTLSSLKLSKYLVVSMSRIEAGVSGG